MDDNYSLWERHEAEQEAWLSRRPVCCYCDQHIRDDHYFEINDEVICTDCLEAHFRKEIEE